MATQLHGGIDLGGTKIETRLFDDTFSLLESRRVPTPADDYAALLDALHAEVAWLHSLADRDTVTVGIGIPGICDSHTGIAHTANLPAKGRHLCRDLSARIDTPVAFENDCRCFTLSEANGGAGDGHAWVYGLIVGTGIGGGVCIDRQLSPMLNSAASEVGHLGIPARLMDEFDLPQTTCGCGHRSCYETLASGPGLERLSQHLLGRELTAHELAQQVAAADKGAMRVMRCWHRLLGELLFNIQLMIDPACIVIGGGLSRLPRVADDLGDVLRSLVLPGIEAPTIVTARFGDASGARGAAIVGARTGCTGEASQADATNTSDQSGCAGA